MWTPEAHGAWASLRTQEAAGPPHCGGLGIRSLLRAPARLPTPRTPPCPSATGAALGWAETRLFFPQDARPPLSR